MKKWIKKQDDAFLAQLREDEHYSLCVKPNERSSGSFSVSIRCMACGKAIMLQQKWDNLCMLFQIGIDMQNYVLPKQGLLKD